MTNFGTKLWTAMALVAAVGCSATVGGGGSGSGSGGGTASSGGSGGGSGGGSSSSTSTSSFCCQINTEAWDCPSQTALNKCFDFNNPDPSSCTPRSKPCSGSTGSSSGGVSSGSTSGGTTSSSGSMTCKGIGTSPYGAACDVDSDCCSDNCTNGTCECTLAGCGCVVDSDCDSNNCTDGTCQL